MISPVSATFSPLNSNSSMLMPLIMVLRRFASLSSSVISKGTRVSTTGAGFSSTFSGAASTGAVSSFLDSALGETGFLGAGAGFDAGFETGFAGSAFLGAAFTGSALGSALTGASGISYHTFTCAGIFEKSFFLGYSKTS